MSDEEAKSPDKGRLRGLHENVRAALRKLRGGELSAGKLAGSVALGLFVGCSPFYGLQTVITAGLAVVFRLDLVISYVASNVTFPPLIPMFLFVEAQLGTRLIHGRWLDVALHELHPEHAADLGIALLVGALLVSTVVAALGAAIAYPLGRRLEQKRQSTD